MDARRSIQSGHFRREAKLMVLAALGAPLLLAVLGGMLLGGCIRTPGTKLPFALQALGAKIQAFHADTGTYPGTLADLTLSGPVDRELGPYARPPELRDPWDRPYFYVPEASGSDLVLFSLGADGKLGGIGEDRDVQYVRSVVQPLPSHRRHDHEARKCPDP